LEKITSKISWPIEQHRRSAIYIKKLEERREKRVIDLGGGGKYIEDVEEDVEFYTALTSYCVVYSTCIK
jgi:hypothetical protein